MNDLLNGGELCEPLIYILGAAKVALLVFLTLIGEELSNTLWQPK